MEDIPSKLIDEDAQLTCSSLETTPLRILSQKLPPLFLPTKGQCDLKTKVRVGTEQTQLSPIPLALNAQQ